MDPSINTYVDQVLKRIDLTTNFSQIAGRVSSSPIINVLAAIREEELINGK